MWLAIYLTMFIWAVAGGVKLVEWLAQPETEPVMVAVLVEEPPRGGWRELQDSNVIMYLSGSNTQEPTSLQFSSFTVIPSTPPSMQVTKLNTQQLETQRAEDERLTFAAAESDTYKSNVVHVWMLGNAFAVERSGGYGPDGLWCYHIYENGHHAILPLNSETAANVRRFWRQLK